MRKTELARNTRKIIGSVREGQTIIIENYGQPEAVIQDILDYRIQRAFIRYYGTQEASGKIIEVNKIDHPGSFRNQDRFDHVLSKYLSGVISLQKAAEMLEMFWMDLRTRFVRLDIPVRSAPDSIDELEGDINALNNEGEMGIGAGSSR